MAFISNDILRLIDDFGEPLTLRKVTTEGTYDPATGGLTGDATTDYVVTGYFYNYETMDLEQVRRGSRKCVIAAQGILAIPDEDDLILGNGDTVTINGVTSIFNAGVAVCYICHVSE